MQMNNQTKLTFALEHIAHLEDYIEKESSLFDPLSTIKIELEKQLKLEQNRRTKMSQTPEDLIVKLTEIADKLGGNLSKLTTYNSAGRTSNKIVIEYDIKEK